MTPIILGGFLGKRFGRRFELAVGSPREAVRALCIQIKGFERALLDHHAGFRVWADKENLAKESIDRITGSRVIRIQPVISGSKSGLGMVIVGALLIWASMGAASFLVGEGMSAGMAGAFASGMSGIGSSLVLGGISQLLFKPPAPPAASVSGQSYLFNGAVNTTAQGSCVPVCYGRMRVGSQMISAGVIPNQMTSAIAVTTPGSGTGWNSTLTNAAG